MIKRFYLEPVAIFFLNPFFLFIHSIIKYKKAWSANSIWVFVIFFGLTFAIGSESEKSDINRYVFQLEYFANNINSFDSAVNYFLDSGDLDIFRYLIAFVVSRFTNQMVWLTFTYSIIFGYFYSRNIIYVLNQIEGKITKLNWVFIFLLIITIPFWNINGFRFWVASHIFINGVLTYFINRNKKGLYLLLISILFHFSFILPLIIFVTYFIIPKNIFLWTAVMSITLFYNEVDTNFINSIVEGYFPNLLSERTNGYLSNEQIERFRNTDSIKNWYAVYYLKFIKYAIILLITTAVISCHKFIKDKKKLFNLYIFTLYFYSISNLLETLPSGIRFSIVSQFFGLVSLIILINNYRGQIFTKFSLVITMPAILLYALVSLRIGFYYMSINSLIGNIFTALIFLGNNLALNDILKGL